MESTISWSIFVVVFGYLLTLIGIIWYESTKRSSKNVSLWTYVLMIGGSIVVVAGLILISFFFDSTY